MKRSPVATEFGRTQPFDEQWLALADPEPIFKPELPIIDTHIHLWDHRSGYRYFVEDLARDVEESGHNVEAAVYVQCDSMYRANGPEHLRCVGETEFAVGQAAVADSHMYTRTRIAAAIVGAGDLRQFSHVDELLDSHMEAANGRFRGIRQRAKWDPDPVVKSAKFADQPGLYLDKNFHQGLRKLASHDLHFEASIYHPQIADVVALARAVPEARIVLVHVGSPVGHGPYSGRLDEVLSSWMAGMAELAACPNVSVKLGGIVMTLATFDFGNANKPINSEELAHHWRPFTEPCIELFGVDRCMVESNFPVDKVGFTYRTCWNMFKRMFNEYSDTEQRALLSETARAFYRI